MSTWDSKVNDGWTHIQPCSCPKCHPEVSTPHKVHATWKEKMIRMNYKMREDAAVMIQKNFRMITEVRRYSLIIGQSCAIKDEPCMIATPVAMGVKSASRRDWNEQVQRRKEGKKHVWDDSSTNRASKGDLFAYVENSVKIGENKKSEGWIEVFVIQEVYSPDFRLPTWSENVGQGNRNVVELSPEPIYVGSMVEWKEQLGYAERYCVQGTINIKHSKIAGYLGKIMQTKKENI